jgi:SAM-dependent methyltransferase
MSVAPDPFEDRAVSGSVSFPDCAACGAQAWIPVYQGPVRDGAFGNSRPDAVVSECVGCGVQRLDEGSCHDDAVYTDDSYRELLGEAVDTNGFHAAHDPLQLERLNVVNPMTLRGKVIADIGCAAGSFLDFVAGLARSVIAVEPGRPYHESLRGRGFHVYSFSENALDDCRGSVEHAFSFQVIEHVSDPGAFLTDITALLAPGGRVTISTPNRGDLLMTLLPEDYPPFFYRAVHRWYFSADSLARCGRAAGLIPVETRFVHRFGVANTLRWLRERAPGGRDPLPGLDDPALDSVWRDTLAREGTADTLYMTFEKPAS